MSKFVIFSLLAVIAVANARGLGGDHGKDNNNAIAPLKMEERTLEVPAVSTIILTSLKALWFVFTKIVSVVNFKLAALAFIVKTGLWVLSYKFPVIVGAVLMLGFCHLTGLCALPSIVLDQPDHLAYAADYLDAGTLKYAGSS